MFKACTASRTLHRAFKPTTLYCHVRGFMEKKPGGRFTKYLEEQNRPPTIEDIKNLNLVPKNFEVIYINQSMKQINGGIWLVYLLGVGAIANFSGYFTDPEWLKKEGALGKINPGFGMMLVLQGIIIYLLVTKSVKCIFKRGEDLKYVFYGVFGSPKVVDQKIHECVGPKNELDMFHYLNKKRIILLPEYFLNFNDYLLILK